VAAALLAPLVTAIIALGVIGGIALYYYAVHEDAKRLARPRPVRRQLAPGRPHTGI
jgi:hypothetical protein